MLHPGDGSKFKREYDNLELTEFLHTICEEGVQRFTSRVCSRIADVGLTVIEVERAVVAGDVIESEVTPSQTELRLEVSSEIGDVTDFVIVVWISTAHGIFIEDIRERPRYAKSEVNESRGRK